MILHILRALFILLMAAVGWSFIKDPQQKLGSYAWLSLGIAVTFGVLVLCVDILSPRKKLAVFSGMFFGLMVGISIAYAISFATPLLVDQFLLMIGQEATPIMYSAIVDFTNLLIGVVTCYLSISFILQTKDDFRFIIPYVEFSKQTKGARPILLDTSVLIDGRIADVISSGIIDSQLIVPRFVLQELQMVADSADKLKRNRGRRGLDTLAHLKENPRIEVIDYDASGRQNPSATGQVDDMLMHLAKDLNARVLTNDFNLNKVAGLRGVDVININELANALKPVVLPGEMMSVRLIKPGEESGQGIGYLDDGTMVVVEQGRAHLNQEVSFIVTNTRQTSAGRMIFGRMGTNGTGGDGNGSHASQRRARRGESGDQSQGPQAS